VDASRPASDQELAALVLQGPNAAAEAMLAMANCQLELKEPRANVRRSLDNLIKLHPKSKAAAEAKELLARLPR
jgi:TolA-binding protein